MPSLESGFKGSLVGLSLGDALGAPFEGSAPGDKPLDSLPRVLRYTDDTQMAIGVAESLAAAGGFDPEDMSRRFANNFDITRGYGAGAIVVLGLIRRGVNWGQANRAVFPEGSYGNGAAMRAAPIGLFFHREPAALKEAAFGASSITHDHILAKEGAWLISYAAGAILRGADDADILNELSSAAGTPEYRGKLGSIRSLLRKDAGREDVVRTLGNTVAAAESAPTALYAYLKEGSDYVRTVRFCIGLGGDTDTIAAMAGALSGAKVGIEGIPPGLVERLEDNGSILRLAEALLEASA